MNPELVQRVGLVVLQLRAAIEERVSVHADDANLPFFFLRRIHLLRQNLPQQVVGCLFFICPRYISYAASVAFEATEPSAFNR